MVVAGAYIEKVLALRRFFFFLSFSTVEGETARF